MSASVASDHIPTKQASEDLGNVWRPAEKSDAGYIIMLLWWTCAGHKRASTKKFSSNGRGAPVSAGMQDGPTFVLIQRRFTPAELYRRPPCPTNHYATPGSLKPCGQELGQLPF